MARDDELLLEPDEHKSLSQRSRIFIAIAVTAAVALVIVIAVVISIRHREPPINPSSHINIIFMISDGMGPASVTLARAAKKAPLTLDDYLTGSSRTASFDSLVTDSAAGATAYSCGVHTYNGGIGIDAEKHACGTVLEAAYNKGMKTGIVVTTRLTDATPGSFGAHAASRAYEDFIARQLLNQTGYSKVIDVMLGGGRRYFDQRPDNIDLLKIAAEMGYHVSTSWSDTVATNESMLLGLYSTSNFPYEIDRLNDKNNTIPSLKEMALKAIEVLNENNDKGFFLMVEGSQIDLAGHSNDAGAQIHEVLAYDDAWAAVIDFAQRDGRTIVISTSDHETGGLTLGYQSPTSVAYPVYAYYPDILLQQTASAGAMAAYIQGGESIESVFEKYAQANLTASDYAQVKAASNMSLTILTVVVARVLGSRALVGWTTTAHTGVDVNLYTYIPSSLPLPVLSPKSYENTDIGKYLEQILGTNLTEITEQLADFNTDQPI